MKHIFLIIAFSGLLSSSGLFAQNKVEISEDDLEEADAHYIYGEYDKALEMYLNFYETQPGNAEFAYRIGVSYIHSNHNEKALEYLKKAKKAGYVPEGKQTIEWDEYQRIWYSEDLDFNLGRAYHLHHEFDQAIEEYDLVEKMIDQKFHGHKHDEMIDVLEHFKEMARNGKKLVADPKEGVKVESIGAPLNTEYEEIAPIINADETMLIFTSRRPNTTGGKRDIDGKFMEDIYVSYKENGNWTEPKGISPNINTATQDAAIALSPDGKTLFTYKSNKHGTGDIYKSTLEGNNWSKPVMLESGINTRAWENSASISDDGNTMVFTSTRSGGFGGEDMYIIRKNDNDEWGEPKNMGSQLNTEYDEDAPFLRNNGNTLYFSSRGHNSMGGFDIFKSEYDDKKQVWSKPENVGYPINSADDDVFFTFTADGTKAYFSSHHEDGLGGQDIYVMSIPDPDDVLAEKQDSIENGVEEAIVVGKITNENDRPIGATIKITDNDTGAEIGVFKSDSKTGEFEFKLPTGHNYGISVEDDEHLPYSDNLDLPKGTYKKKVHDIKLRIPDHGEHIALRNVFFAVNRHELLESSFAELDKYVAYLKKHPELEIQISGHTDSDGTEMYNMALSQRRAESVMNYLISKGVDASKLSHKGYGESKPIATNRTAEGKQLNRRVELKVL